MHNTTLRLKPVPVKFLALGLLASLTGCARSSQEHTPPPTRPAVSSPAPPVMSAVTSVAPALSTTVATVTPSSPAATAQSASSAYVGCAQPIPSSKLWDE